MKDKIPMFLSAVTGGYMLATRDTVLGATRSREMTYLGVCLTCEEEKIRAMLQRSREISYAAARHAIGPTVLDAWALMPGLIVGSS